MGCGASKSVETTAAAADSAGSAHQAKKEPAAAGAAQRAAAPVVAPSQLADVNGNNLAAAPIPPAPPSSSGSEEEDDPDAAEKKKEKARADLLNRLHNQTRWNRLDQVKAIIDANPDVPINEPEPRNGNTSLHIAAQNGHLDMVKMLVSYGGDVNRKNAGGQTALHMTISYDLEDVAAFLKASGADENAENEEGHPAKWGLNGEKNKESPLYKLDQFKAATTTAEFLEALELLKGVGPGNGVEVATVAKTALGKKRENKAEWTPECQGKLGEVMSALG